jgi:hypothetical protein
MYVLVVPATLQVPTPRPWCLPLALDPTTHLAWGQFPSLKRYV